VLLPASSGPSTYGPKSEPLFDDDANKLEEGGMPLYY